MAVSLLACLVFGLAPAMQAVAGSRFRHVLLAAQAGLPVVLLFGAVLFAAELRALLVIDTGFDRQRMLLAEVDPMLNGYDNAARLRLYKGLEKRLGEMAIPATLANVAPMP